MSYEPIWFSLRKAIESADYNQDGLENVNDVRSLIENNIIRKSKSTLFFLAIFLQIINKFFIKF
jgi:hypothetical protein